MAELVREMKAYANIPIIAKPNDGMPEVIDGETVYRMTPEEFAAEADCFWRQGPALWRMLRYNTGAYPGI